MAGQHQHVPTNGREYIPDASKNWKLIGFQEFNTRITQGHQDVRVPIVSDRLPQVPITTFAGMQLRQPLSLLSQKFNVKFAEHTGQVYQPQATQLATNKVSTGLGLGKLKNLNVQARPNFQNLLARATSFGRLSAQIPVS